MSFPRFLLAMTAIGTLSACGAPQIVSRSQPFEAVPVTAPVSPPAGLRAVAMTPGAQHVIPERPQVAPPAFDVVRYEIRVPEDLTVSEANLYYPIADIVWRGDPHGHRKKQVGEIFQTSLEAATAGDTPGRKVRAEIELARFHSVTEKTRYTVGGVHSITFFITLRDPETGRIVVPRYEVKADLAALGGRRAIASDTQGLTMKARIIAHLERVLAVEFAQPGAWQDNDTRLARAVDQI